MQLSEMKEVSSQVKLYNRHFYVRRAQYDLLQQQHQLEIKQLANTPKITPSSYCILSKKLQASIQTAIMSVIGERKFMSFLQMQKILKYFNRTIPNDDKFGCQLWLLLNGYQIVAEARKDVLFATLRVLMDPYNLSSHEMKSLIIKIPFLSDIDEKRAIFLEQQPQLKQQTLQVNQLLINCINYKFKNIQLNKNQQSMKALIKTQNEKLPFRPTISKKSKMLAEQHNVNYINQNYITNTNELNKYFSNSQDEILPNSYHQMLFHRKLQKDSLLKTIQPHQKIISPVNSRVAGPSEINKIVNNLYYKKEKKEDVDQKVKLQQQELKLCTFQPRINKSSSARSISPSVRSYKKEVDRLAKARQEQKRKKQIYDNLGRVKKRVQSYGAPSFIQRDAPKLILQVRIDESRVQKISLKGDEDPKMVAKKFVWKHNLAQSMQSVLQELVQQQLGCL